MKKKAPAPGPAAPYMLLSCPVSEAEHATVLEIMAASGLPSYHNVIRTALFHLARHYGLPIHHDTFRLESSRPARRKLLTDGK